MVNRNLSESQCKQELIRLERRVRNEIIVPYKNSPESRYSCTKTFSTLIKGTKLAVLFSFLCTFLQLNYGHDTSCRIYVERGNELLATVIRAAYFASCTLFVSRPCTRCYKYYELLRITRKNMTENHSQPNISSFLFQQQTDCSVVSFDNRNLCSVSQEQFTLIDPGDYHRKSHRKIIQRHKSVRRGEGRKQETLLETAMGEMLQFVMLSLYFSPRNDGATSIGTHDQICSMYINAHLLFGIFNASHLLCSLNLSTPLDTGWYL